MLHDCISVQHTKQHAVSVCASKSRLYFNWLYMRPPMTPGFKQRD